MKNLGPTKDINPYDNKLKGVVIREAAASTKRRIGNKSIVRRERMGLLLWRLLLRTFGLRAAAQAQ